MFIVYIILIFLFTNPRHCRNRIRSYSTDFDSSATAVSSSLGTTAREYENFSEKVIHAELSIEVSPTISLQFAAIYSKKISVSEHNIDRAGLEAWILVPAT